MNTTASFSSEHSWSRRCSTETIFSIQGKETDCVRDTSDTEWDGSVAAEYEPASSEADEPPLSGDASDTTDNEIISTKVIEISVGDDGELQLADSEQTDSEGSDSEMDLYDYWLCAQCRAENNNPLYRYCEKCFKVRKNLFPPRPKRKHKRNTRLDPDTVPRSLSRDSGLVSGKPNTAHSALDSETGTKCEPEPFSRTFSQDSGVESLNSQDTVAESSKSENSFRHNVILGSTRQSKRRAESVDRDNKRIKVGSDSEADLQSQIKPLVKMVSDPALSFGDVDGETSTGGDGPKDRCGQREKDDLCITCLSEPKSGVFVHGRIAHICCCYRCAVKVWATAKRCPVCNCKVSNVLKAVVM